MLFSLKWAHHKWRCHLKCICDVLDEACSSLCNDTPASLMCYASHLVTIFLWAWLSSCVFLGPLRKRRVNQGDARQKEGSRGGSVIRCLFNFSNSRRCHSHLYLLRSPFFLLLTAPDWFITEQKGDRGITKAVGVSPFSHKYIIDAAFLLLLEHLSCIMHMKFTESIIVYRLWWVWEQFSFLLNLQHVDYKGGFHKLVSVADRFEFFSVIWTHCETKLLH